MLYIQLVPIPLVHVPCRCNLRVAVAQHQCSVGIAFNTEPCGILQIHYCKYLVFHPEGKRCFVKREILGCTGLTQTIYACILYIHTATNLGKKPLLYVLWHDTLHRPQQLLYQNGNPNQPFYCAHKPRLRR